MPRVKNVFTDYNGTFDPKYLEILLGYALKDLYKNKGNKKGYVELRNKQFRLWKKFLTNGSDAALDDFVDIVLIGENRKRLEEAMETVSSGRRDYVSYWVKIAGTLHKKIGERVFGEIDSKAAELFRRARERGLTTGVYSRSTKDIIKPYLEAVGMGDCFEHIIANKLEYDGNEIVGLKENVKEGKPCFSEHMHQLGLDPAETAYIDDKCTEAVAQAGVGIIYTPDSWEEIGGILEI
jgi:FMN phosphatase YigB (HAD superfamily)